MEVEPKESAPHYNPHERDGTTKATGYYLFEKHELYRQLSEVQVAPHIFIENPFFAETFPAMKHITS